MDLPSVKNDNIFSHISERDVDLLLVEEFYSSKIFMEYFLTKINFTAIYNENIIVKPFHSVSGLGKTQGETDIFIVLEDDSGKFGLLIENKIDTDFQLRQFERYNERARMLIESYEFNKTMIVLVCPKEYLTKKDIAFKNIVTYEDLYSFFEKQEVDNSHLLESKLRYQYKKKVMFTAIEKCRRGYEAVHCEKSKLFYRNLNELIENNYPDIEMNMHKQIKIPKESVFVPLKLLKLDDYSSLPVKLKLKFRNDKNTGLPRVDLELKDFTKYENEFTELFTARLYENMKPKKTGKSMSLSYDFQPVDTKNDFEQQKSRIIEALNKVMLLKEWYVNNYKMLLKFKEEYRL